MCSDTNNRTRLLHTLAALDASAACSSMQRPKVLVVDDGRLNRAILSRQLGKLGFSVLEANNGLEGCNLYGTHGTDIVCIFLDLNMPVLDGWQTATRLREMEATSTSNITQSCKCTCTGNISCTSNTGAAYVAVPSKRTSAQATEPVAANCSCSSCTATASCTAISSGFSPSPARYASPMSSGRGPPPREVGSAPDLPTRVRMVHRARSCSNPGLGFIPFTPACGQGQVSDASQQQGPWQQQQQQQPEVTQSRISDSACTGGVGGGKAAQSQAAVRIPVIVCTANDLQAVHGFHGTVTSSALSAGADAVMNKPMSTAVVQLVLDRHLPHWRQLVADATDAAPRAGQLPTAPVPAVSQAVC